MTSSQTILVVGAGPGLGLSIAGRFGRDGRPVALVSRNADRHDGYLASLRSEGITARAFAADAGHLEAVIWAVTDELGPIGAVYYGPGAADPSARPAPILQTRAPEVDEAIRTLVRPAIDLTGMVLPGMIERGHGTLLYVAGLSAVVPLPFVGALALASAAIRTYALTLNAALDDTGVYAGALVIGGLIERGDIHRHAIAAAGPGLPTLDPDEIAGAAFDLATRRTTPEATFNALT